MSIKENYDKIIRNVFNLSDDSIIDENMSRENSEIWDSLLHLTLVTTIEDEFDIMIDVEDILSFNSYKNGLEIIEKYTIKG